MTIDQAITALQSIKAKHGGTALVYFDCPHCLVAFTPGQLAVEAVHLTGRKGDSPKEPTP
jgi:hypothetical protein